MLSTKLVELIKSINKYNQNINNIVFTDEIFNENIILESSYNNIIINKSIDSIKYLKNFFEYGIIKEYDILDNLIRIKFHKSHEQVLFVNIMIEINQNLISKLKMYNNFFIL